MGIEQLTLRFAALNFMPFSLYVYTKISMLRSGNYNLWSGNLESGKE